MLLVNRPKKKVESIMNIYTGTQSTVLFHVSLEHAEKFFYLWWWRHLLQSTKLPTYFSLITYSSVFLTTHSNFLSTLNVISGYISSCQLFFASLCFNNLVILLQAKWKTFKHSLFPQFNYQENRCLMWELKIHI